MNNKNLKHWRVANAVVWTIVSVVLMVTCYFEWSKYGEYTFMSFLSSLVFHGGLGFCLGIIIDSYLKKRMK